MNNKIYKTFSEFLKERYGEKVYKLPINLPLSCPNRDGKIAFGGCIFCSEIGAGFESLSSKLSVMEQIEKNMNYIGENYGSKKFIIYFQNFTNTYMPLKEFENVIHSASVKNVVAVSISTRPDCINEKYLDVLKKFSNETGIDVIVELGLQTVNYKTLEIINRGHSLAEFIFAVNLIKKYNFLISTHIILNLPWDNMLDVIECSKILSALYIDFVKIHSLHIMENTKIAKMYKENEIEIIKVDEYVNRVAEFLCYLSPNIAVERLLSRAPKENSLFVNWGMSWWKIKDMIEQKMIQENLYQGKKFDYLMAKPLLKFN